MGELNEFTESKEKFGALCMKRFNTHVVMKIREIPECE